MRKLLCCLLVACAKEAPPQGPSLGAVQAPVAPADPAPAPPAAKTDAVGGIKAQLDRIKAEELERAARARYAPPLSKSELRDSKLLDYYTMVGPSPAELLAFADKADRAAASLPGFGDPWRGRGRVLEVTQMAGPMTFLHVNVGGKAVFAAGGFGCSDEIATCRKGADVEILGYLAGETPSGTEFPVMPAVAVVAHVKGGSIEKVRALHAKD